MGDGSCALEFSEDILWTNEPGQGEYRSEKAAGKCLGDFQREDVRITRGTFSHNDHVSIFK